MAVTFAALVDGQPYLDGGFHDITVSDNKATTWLTRLGFPVSVPGSATGADLRQKVYDYIASPDYALLNAADRAAVDKIRIVGELGTRHNLTVVWQ